MELIRGKTFIKSYGQHPSEKVSSAGVKEKNNISSEKIVSECNIKKEDFGTQKVSKGTSIYEANDNFSFPKCVRKSKTHDCVTKENKTEQISSENVKARLSTSISFSGVENNLNNNGKRNNTNVTHQQNSSQHMIDYRNFVPQMPFVPSVAKSLPRKRISLKRSKKGLKNIFQLKKNKQGLVSVDENDRLQPTVFQMEERKGVDKHINNKEMYSDELLVHEFPDNELYIDTIEYCRTLCEDVASLKSFDSLTGCGEIYADESSADIENCKDGHNVKFNSKEIPIGRSFQGGIEKLASPAKSETIDFARLCGRVTNTPSQSFCSNLAFDTTFSRTSNNSKETNQDVTQDNFSNSSNNDLMSSNDNFTDAGSPVSTSDEGYYDSFSPGIDEDKKEVETPRSFPRDSYSGDALFELFCDPNEQKLSPVPDYNLSISGQSSDVPMSIYSFCVGSEETMASQPSEDLVGNDNHHSLWKGQECLMKLCDTELTLTMGLVNWLKKTGKNIELQDTNSNLFCSSEQCEPNELSDESHTEDNNKTSSDNNLTTHTAEEKHMKSANAVSRNKANPDINSEHLQINKTSTKEIEKSLLEYNSCSSEKMTVSGTISEENVSNHELPTTRHNGGKETDALELISPCINNSAQLDTMHILSSRNVSPHLNGDDQKHLRSLSLTCVTSCLNPVIAENDKILDQCATQVASLQITYMDQSKHHQNNMSIEKVLKPYEIEQNLKNVTDLQDYLSQQSTLYSVFSDKSQFETNKKHVKILPWKESSMKNTTVQLAEYKNISNYNDKTNEECTLKHDDNQHPTKTEITNFVSRPNYLPLFSSQCPSVISSCSSTVYKMRNSANTVLFFNTPVKSNKSISNTEEMTKDSNFHFQAVSSKEVSKNTMHELKAISPTNCITRKVCSSLINEYNRS
ncbi:APC membrane recruitment protein 3 [Discoglossus pictus]